MSDQIVLNRLLADELHKRGLIPKDCASVEILTRPDGALKIRYEVFVRASGLAKVAEAMKACADRYAESDNTSGKVEP